jgi:hypothetical protein
MAISKSREAFIGRKIAALTVRSNKVFNKIMDIGEKAADANSWVETMDYRIDKQAEIIAKAQQKLSQPATILRPDIQIAMAARIAAASAKSAFFGLQKSYWINRRERLLDSQDPLDNKLSSIDADIQALQIELNK